MGVTKFRKNVPAVFDKSSIRAKFFKILLKQQQQQQNIYTAVSSAKCCSLSVLRKDILDIHVPHFFQCISCARTQTKYILLIGN